MFDNTDLSLIDTVEIFIVRFYSPFFPGQEMELQIFSDDVFDSAKEALEKGALMGFLSYHPVDNYSFDVGTLCSAEEVFENPEGKFVKFKFRCRFQALEMIEEEEFFARARVRVVNDKETKPFLQQKNLSELKESYVKITHEMRKLFLNFPSEKELQVLPIGSLADHLAAFLAPQLAWMRQRILEEFDPVKRLDKILRYFENWLRNVKSNDDVLKKQKEKSRKTKVTSGRKDDIAFFEEKLEQIRDKLTDEAERQIEREIKNLLNTSVNNSEYQKSFNWLVFALDFFGLESTEDNGDIEKVWSVLDEDHYGLGKVKERIYEELIVRQVNPDKKGLILCFVGPPGVGKTSLGRSIARALGRKFTRMSLGGVRDEAEIRGHRSTYVGAKPGALLQNIVRAGSSNPVFMLDEIDKVGKDSLSGNPEAALLEVLDPAENHSFSDHYLDLGADLSKVMFITTANTVENIIPALKDRMEIIELSGYTYEEKLHIAEEYLVSRQIEQNGLNFLGVKVGFSKSVMRKIIDSYTCESGVRSLERVIGMILRKTTKELCVGGLKGDVKIDNDLVKKFLGAPKFFLKEVEKTPPGVAFGVAVTPTGGEILKVEAIIVNEKGQGVLKLTGNLEKVIKESAEVALSFFRARIKTQKTQKIKNDIHLHVPDGAVRKDGPSAGVAIACAFYSCFHKKPAKKGLVMTGEVDLLGNVTAVGGIKEKVVAAERAGAGEFILPDENKSDLDDLSEDLKKKIKIHLVKDIDEALDIAFVRK